MLSKLFKPKPKVTAKSADPMQEIGRSILAAVANPDGKMLLYVEAEYGVISADIFSQDQPDEVSFRFAPADLKAMLYQLWEATPEVERWATMAFVVERGRFDCSLRYMSALVADEDLSDRRPRAVKAVFGDATVNYGSAR
ncbi:MAG: hypothetical protein JF588_19925 [Caulobacterales bacterium]|nr:hypothetical protein [Caulobacterales bacterium]